MLPQLRFLQEFLRLIRQASFFLPSSAPAVLTALLCRAHIRTSSARTIARGSEQTMIHHVGDQSREDLRLNRATLLQEMTRRQCMPRTSGIQGTFRMVQLRTCRAR